ncbi:DUF4376 domain-containing protein [Pseudomonas sp. NyZ704]|nr:DUF4376 domain-containing protein [Pseudomonas sp. NyZ704]
MWARIEGGAVAEITDINPAGRFHPSLNWAACPQGVAPGWSFDGESFAQPVAPEQTADDHRKAVAAERYKRETAGITMQGMQIDTGRDSQALITGATVQAMLDPAYALRWKTPAGFVELTAEQIIAVASAARAHVQACFDREADLLDEITAGTFTEAMLQEGWP